ncbi:GREB1-like protein [Gossypium arboreum]|uniref:GREB1-like protein n=1 Tax=Gossypium arboreum TaxID=29729 RepID=A0A0B0MZW8_GOSAR|nr:GREB1-like protein [Gossypium arboreum]
MSWTCFGHIMRASVRPCLGHDIYIQTRASVKHVWDMHQPYYESQCKTMSGTRHRHPDEG